MTEAQIHQARKAQSFAHMEARREQRAMSSTEQHRAWYQAQAIRSRHRTSTHRFCSTSQAC